MTRSAPTISIVTPNYNGVAYLRDAVESVLGQRYPALEYAVVDGASTDGSRLVLEPFRDALFALIVEPDDGHADALNKGFAQTSGEIMGWINSDDMLHPGCLARVADIFQTYRDVEWITGRPSAMGASGVIEHVDEVRPWSRLRFLAGDHAWIQQESTFWRRSLWERAGGRVDTDLSLANDFELWARFFRHAPLYSVDQLLGCFRVRPGQRSVMHRTRYDCEVHSVLRRELDHLEEGWRRAYGAALPAAPRTLSPAQKAALEPRLRAYDPPVIGAEALREGRALKGGGPRFSATAQAPEPISDLSALKNRHAGERCVILGNGPSLNDTDLDLLQDETVFACNAAFLLFDRIDWRPAYFTCVDSRVLPDRADDITAMLAAEPGITAFFPAELVDHSAGRRRTPTRTLIPDAPGRYFFNEEVGSLDDLPWSQFSTDVQAAVIQPHTVTITMLQLAAYMGFSEICLVGCDMRYTVPESAEREDARDAGDPRLRSTGDDPNHFDAAYFGAGRKWHRPDVNLMREHYRIAGEALEALGLTVRNATVGGNLDVFERADLAEVVSRPPSPRRPATARPTRRAAQATPSLTALRIRKAAQIARNNQSLIVGGAALGAAALALGWLLPDQRVWIALAAGFAALAAGLATLALKARRITRTLTVQLHALQNQHARAELALQKARDEFRQVSTDAQPGEDERAGD